MPAFSVPRGTIEQLFAVSEGYDIPCSIPALCKPHKYRLFACLNIHAGIASCYAVDRYFRGWEYKLLTVYFIKSAKPRCTRLYQALSRNTSSWIEGASVLSVCALLITQQQRLEKPSRTRSAKFILDGFSSLCYSLSVKTELG